VKVLIVEGYDSDLQHNLNELIEQGHAIRFVLPNGVNRWTIIAEKVGSIGDA
jgi:hypothetical protein